MRNCRNGLYLWWLDVILWQFDVRWWMESYREVQCNDRTSGILENIYGEIMGKLIYIDEKSVLKVNHIIIDFMGLYEPI